ncbi:DUF6612 family protein [Alkalihalobacillus sp. 1P02AB]|uniref:DUF6612 family protein n=1 Tax=Alkalihalobacillus sp. 1P02AB TaxID=3132260 RepID=UPI0039A4D300
MSKKLMIVLSVTLFFFLVACTSNNETDDPPEEDIIHEEQSSENEDVSSNDAENETTEGNKVETAEVEEATETDALTNEAFFAEFKQAMNALESYEIDVLMELGAQSMGEISYATLTMAGELYEDFTYAYIELTVEENGEFSRSEYYQDYDVMYLNEGESGWLSGPSEPLVTDSDTSYTNIANGLLEIQDIVTVEETTYHYEIQYFGNDIDVFYAFQKPFDLSFQGFNLEKHLEMELFIYVDKESYHMYSFTFNILADNNESIAYIETNATFDRFNEIGEIIVPEEVVEKANNNTN